MTELPIGVVIPVYNRSETLRRTLASLETVETDPASLTVVVADDGSEEDIEGLMAEWDPPFTSKYVRQEHEGFGAARARNLGAATLGSGVVVFLDSDGLVRPDFVSRHRAWHESTAVPNVVIGRRVHVEGAELSPREIRDGAIDLTRVDTQERQDFRSVLARRSAGYSLSDEGYRAFVSSNVSLPVELFNQVGGFDERFRWWGSEDSELGWRLWQAGANFVDDTENIIYHQLDTDTAGGAEGRQRARELNRGLLVSLVPQRFYRKKTPDPLPEVPKVSVVAHSLPPGAPEELWKTLRRGTFLDFEVIFVAQGADHDPFAGSTESEPRISFHAELPDALEATRGEYVVVIHGHGAPSRTMLQNIVKRLDQRPSASTLTFGVEVPQVGVFSRRQDIAHLDVRWESPLPVALAVRRRWLARAMLQDGEIAKQLLLTVNDAALHTTQALLAMPGEDQTQRPANFTFAREGLRDVWEEARLGPTEAFQAGLRVARKRMRPVPRPKPEPRRADQTDSERGVRYVGWVGKENLGDEAMLHATEQLMPWAEVTARGEARDLLLLGGGTLINRNQYLRWLLDRDSPRLERAVFGTGVANPKYWGLTEDPDQWKNWLATCVYVGVRGPHSLDTLTEWGVPTRVEICGDPALALRPPPTEVEDGSVLIAPVSTSGELWGGADETVYSTLADAARSWIDEGRRVVLMSCHPSDDRPILLIREQLEGRPTEYLAGYLDVAASMDRIARSGLVIGERLHACVLAAAAGRPFVGLEYRPKVADFAASVGMEEHVVRTDQLSTGFLVEQARELSTPPDVMIEKVAEYRARLEAAAATIKKSLDT